MAPGTPRRGEITLFASQYCKQWGKPQTASVTMHLMPVNVDFTSAEVTLDVDCFGTIYWIDQSKQFMGSLHRSGDSVSLVATHRSPKTPIEATGTLV